MAIMTYAEIKDGKVINRSVWEKDPPAELGLKRVDNIDPSPQIDWDYDEATKKFTATPVVKDEYVAPTKLGDIDLTIALKDSDKDLILKKIAQDMIDKGIE